MIFDSRIFNQFSEDIVLSEGEDEVDVYGKQRIIWACLYETEDSLGSSIDIIGFDELDVVSGNGDSEQRKNGLDISSLQLLLFRSDFQQYLCAQVAYLCKDIQILEGLFFEYFGMVPQQSREVLQGFSIDELQVLVRPCDNRSVINS